MEPMRHVPDYAVQVGSVRARAVLALIIGSLMLLGFIAFRVFAPPRRPPSTPAAALPVTPPPTAPAPR
jgi:hypothetical protein